MQAPEQETLTRPTPFTREPLRFLNEEGLPIGDQDPRRITGLTDAQLVDLYRAMVLSRKVDQMGWILVRQGKAGFYISIQGQEGAQVASLLALEPQDWVMPYYRTPPALHVRGATLVELFGQILGTNADPSKGRQMPAHFGKRDLRIFVLGSPVGLGHVVAMGAAKALKYRRENAVVITYGGEGSTSEPHFHSAMNFAGVYRLPLIVFIFNNQYAISVPRAQQTASETLAEKARAYGFEGYYVDGSDPLAVYWVTRFVAERARTEHTPALIEALTYRLDPHSSADDDLKYRSREEVEAWKQRESLARMRRYLEHLGLWNEEKEQALHAEYDRAIEEAVEQAEQAGPPRLDEMFHEVYHTTPWYLQEEAREARRFAEEQEGSHA